MRCIRNTDANHSRGEARRADPLRYLSEPEKQQQNGHHNVFQFLCVRRGYVYLGTFKLSERIMQVRSRSNIRTEITWMDSAKARRYCTLFRNVMHWPQLHFCTLENEYFEQFAEHINPTLFGTVVVRYSLSFHTPVRMRYSTKRLCSIQCASSASQWISHHGKLFTK